MPQPTSSPPVADAPANVPSLRRLGTGSTDAAAGDDPRFGTPTNAQLTPAPNSIPLSNGAGFINQNWLPDVGPGAGAYGGPGSYLESLNLNAKGQIASLITSASANINFGVANLAALTAINMAPFSSTAIILRHVATKGQWYYWDGSSTLTPDGSTIIAATGAGRWIALPAINALWTAQHFWAVDPVGGNDENFGCGVSLAAAQSVPLKTLRELNRRLLGSLYDFQSLFGVMNDVPLSDATVMHNVRSVNGLGFPTMIGTKTQIGSDFPGVTFTAANDAAPGGGTAYLIDKLGIGDPAFVGKLMESADGTKCAWVLSAPTVNQIRISTPGDSDPIEGKPSVSGSAVSFAGETVRFFDIPGIPVYPFGPLAAFSGLGWLRFGFGYVTPDFHAGQIGPASPFIARCKAQGAFMNQGVSGAWADSMFTANGSTPTIMSGHSAFVRSCAVTGGDQIIVPGLLLQSGSVVSGATIDLQASFLQVADSALGGTVRAFDCSHGLVSASGGSRVRLSNAVGRGGSGPILSVQRATSSFVGSVNYQTSAASNAVVAGDNKDIPLSALDTGTFIAGSA